MDNKLLIAAAGAGKTTYLVRRALEIKNESVLILTYTIENEQEIRSKFLEINIPDRCVPANITIGTWFSFLIQHGVKPYQGKVYSKSIKGMIFVESQSGIKYISNGIPYTYSESDGVDKYYLSERSKIYSDKLSKFVVLCNEKSNGAVIRRLAEVYRNIFIDEVQDLAGYDLDVLLLLFESSSKIILVGDPRQTTYLTHHGKRHKQYKNGKIREFVETECKKKYPCEVDLTTLNNSWRNNELICCFSSLLYPNFPAPRSYNNTVTGHDGVFLVKESDVEKYLTEYCPVQLRWSNNTKGVSSDYPIFNFGQSKGKGYDRVLVFPTNTFLDWMKNHNTSSLKDTPRAKFYVALTRAKYSVGIVLGVNDFNKLQDIAKYNLPVQKTLF